MSGDGFAVSGEPYFLIRFSALNAHHDKGIKGISNEIAERLVKILEPHGTIYISSERPLEPQFEKYRMLVLRLNTMKGHLSEELAPCTTLSPKIENCLGPP